MDHITLDADELNELLRVLNRALELAEATDNIDLVISAGVQADMLIDKWERRNQ